MNHKGWGGFGGFGPGGFGGDWGRGGPWGPGPQGGPPPWLAEMLGVRQRPAQRPRARRGDVRAAILDVLREADGQPVNGYQIIQHITERTDGAWTPSPGSVYPTIQQLEDEGLVTAAGGQSRRGLVLTDAGGEYVDGHEAELAAVWEPFDSTPKRSSGREYAELAPEIGQVLSAVWQIVTQGSERQRRAAIDVLVDTRRRLYSILGEGDEGEYGGGADEEDR